MEETITFENLWDEIKAHEGETFYTVKGLPFTYRVRGGELFTERKKQAFLKVRSKPEEITGPKRLNVFGGPYVWAIFMKLGIVEAKSR